MSKDIYIFLLMFCKDRHTAEDILQDKFISIYENAGHYKYLKLIPYNSNPIPEIISYIGTKRMDEGFLESGGDPGEYYLESKADVNNLPQIFKQSKYGNVLIESCIVTDEDITVTYKYEGMVIPPFIVATDGEKVSIAFRLVNI